MDDSEFHRLKRLPPYVFAEVNAMKARARGAEIELNTRVERVLIENGKARGVLVSNGGVERIVEAAGTQILQRADRRHLPLRLIGRRIGARLAAGARMQTGSDGEQQVDGKCEHGRFPS